MVEPDGDSLLIYAPVPLWPDGAGGWLVEAQAANGLRLWAENFDSVAAMMPVGEGPAPEGWVPLAAAPGLERVRVVPLPTAYRPDRFLRALGPVRRVIRGEIARARWLSFAIGGLFGDWGAVAAFEAHRAGRRFAAWTDRVESEVVRRAAREAPRRKERLRARLYHRPMAALERAVIRRAALGLFHGRETYETYAPHSRNPQMVHDILIGKEFRIGPEALAAKRAGAAEGPLRIVYAGRADPMKGPMDWVAVLARLAGAGVAFEAAWLGDGTERAAMRAAVEAAGIAGQVRLPGFLPGRDEVMAEIAAAQVFLFCHKTPESPRCLIEALMSGTPLLGYDSAFPRDLIAAHGGGRLVARDDVAGLAAAVEEVARDRGSLAGLIGAAAADGAPFDDESVFRHRSEVIRAGLGPGPVATG